MRLVNAPAFTLAQGTRVVMVRIEQKYVNFMLLKSTKYVSESRNYVKYCLFIVCQDDSKKMINDDFAQVFLREAHIFSPSRYFRTPRRSFPPHMRLTEHISKVQCHQGTCLLVKWFLFRRSTEACPTNQSV